ncbi:MAG TPA: metal ABC transporter permease [Bryobacteraceae bacterium]|nr:metal ABC transporter permease [Bryobacteraceae bacterium]
MGPSTLAATAKRLATNLTTMLTVAMTIAVASTVAGTWLAQGLHRETGPLIVTVSAGCFLLSLAKRMHR